MNLQKSSNLNVSKIHTSGRPSHTVLVDKETGYKADTYTV